MSDNKTINYVLPHISHRGGRMGNMTLSIPDVMLKRMGEHSEYKWSEVARKAIAQKLDEAEMLDDLRAFAKGEKEFREGKTISFEKLAKKLGLENDLRH